MLTGNKNEKGFLIYFSVLFAGVALGIGLFILNVAYKELVLSGLARQADYAFYAAEAGAECALYWDTIGVNSRTAFPMWDTDIPNAYLGSVSCSSDWNLGAGGAAASVAYSTPNSATTVFQFNTHVDSTPVSYCSSVAVSKIRAPDGTIVTFITSRGYNVDCATCCGATPSLRSDKLERALLLLY